MYCSTCGARVPDGRSRCDTCGAPVSAPSGYGVPAAMTAASPLDLTCPQCGFHGQGVSYFSQGGHVAGLVLLALLTAFPLLGAGGLVYFLLRHDHRVCPRCGHGWGKRGERARALMPGMRPAAGALPHPAGLAALPSGGADLEVGNGNGWRYGAWALFAFAAFMIMLSVSGEGFEEVVFAVMSAGGGAMMLKQSHSAREERRRALLVGLQQPVLRLAEQRAGRLTVTEVASSLGWPMPRAEKVLNSLEDGWRVASDVTDEGVIVYEFRELMHAPRLSAGEMDPLLNPGAAGGEGTVRA